MSNHLPHKNFVSFNRNCWKHIFENIIKQNIQNGSTIFHKFCHIGVSKVFQDKRRSAILILSLLLITSTVKRHDYHLTEPVILLLTITIVWSITRLNNKYRHKTKSDWSKRIPSTCKTRSDWSFTNMTKCFLSTTKIWFDWLRFFCTNKNTFFMMIWNLINNILFFFNITWRTNAHQSILVVLGMIFILFLQFISLVKICLPMTGQCWRKRKLVKNIQKIWLLLTATGTEQ